MLKDNTQSDTVSAQGVRPALIRPQQPIPLPSNESEREQAVEGQASGKRKGRPAPDSSEGSSTVVSVPISRFGGSIIVHAQLNSRRDVQLILDTGATMTVLSYDVALELGLLSGPDNTVATVNTAGGPVQASLTRLDVIQVGAAEVRNMAVAIHDIPASPCDVVGILGLSFLDHFLVTLDTDKGQLHLGPRTHGMGMNDRGKMLQGAAFLKRISG